MDLLNRSAGPAEQGVAAPHGIGQDYGRVGVRGVFEIVQLRSQGQDTCECTAESKCLDITFVRRAGRLPAVALSLVIHTRGLGSINVTWCQRHITLRPV